MMVKTAQKGATLRKCNGIASSLVAISLILSALHLHAFITALIPLQDILKQSTYIVTAEVASVDADKPELVIVVEKDLKGKAPLRRFVIHLKGDHIDRETGHVAALACGRRQRHRDRDAGMNRCR